MKIESDVTAFTISCVIPTHNRSDFLAKSLKSISEQTLSPLEVVVVSDVVDPSAEQLCQELGASAPYPIRYVYDPETRGGASASRNVGAREARGDVLAFLDDDDLWLPEYLEKVTALLSSSGQDMVVTWRTLVKGGVTVDGPAMEEGLRASDVVAVSYGTTGSNMAMTRGSFWRADGFDDQMPVKNDTDFFFRFLKAGGSYAVLRDRLVLQVKHGSGQLTNNDERRAAGTEVYMQKHRSDLKLKDRRHLRLSIHRIRYHMAPDPVRRYYHLALALVNYSPAKYLEERRLRRMWLDLDRKYGEWEAQNAMEPASIR
ncbi:glycosyltransferase family 2 protein [Herbiconiux sp. UC225_62]|uniref:glycosyltransferase family 2 protein n=1 Tax=Herbiconiux sp. UC225_62 TaxID=3350168 RepID=UPI0036D30879